METMKSPFVDLTIAGVAAGLELGGALKSFTYQDHHHGKVDEIAFTVADPDGRYRKGWVIDEGTEIQAVLGYERGARIDCGLYAEDESESEGGASGDTATFRALSAFTSKELRSKRSAAYDEMTLAEIVARVADRHELEVVGEIPEVSFARVTQTRESDLAFLTRLAEDYGCYFSIKGDQLVFIDRTVVEAAEPVRTFEIDDGLKSWRLRKSTHKLFAKARLEYLNARTKAKIIAEVADPRVASGDVLKLDDKVETQAQADRLCLARLLIENDGQAAGSLTLPGDPHLVAGQVIAIGESGGRYEGRWLVRRATHKADGGGYTTSIDIKSLGDV